MSEAHYKIALKKGVDKEQIVDELTRDTTSDASVDSMLMASQYGGSDYLVKPFTLNEFQEKIAEGWKMHIPIAQDEIQILKRQIVELEEENLYLKEKLNHIKKII